MDMDRLGHTRPACAMLIKLPAHRQGRNFIFFGRTRATPNHGKNMGQILR